MIVQNHYIFGKKSENLLLDIYNGASYAFSIRKLSSSYNGNCIRVRRSSDNSELDIGFDINGDLDITALSSFVGANDGYVSIWYNQDGTSNNLIQTTNASQPIIIETGVLKTVNGKAAIVTNSNSLMVSENFISIAPDSLSYVFNYFIGSRQASGAIISVSSGSGWNLYQTSNVINNRFNSTTLSYSGTFTTNTQVALSLYRDNSSNGTLYKDGASLISGTLNNNWMDRYMSIGKTAFTNSTSGASYQEIVSWVGDKYSVINDIHANGNNYFNIY